MGTPARYFRTLEVSAPRFERDGLRHLTVKSPALLRRSDIVLWVPPMEYGAELPLAILLHGVYGSSWSWAFSGGAHLTAARLLAEEAIPPMAIAMPSDGLWGDGSGYLNHRELGQYEEWIVQEVPRAVRQAEPRLAREGKCGLAGLSMGGYGALRLGARHPHRFAAISAHSSITHFRELAQFVEEPLGQYHVPASEESALVAILEAGAHLPPLRFDCGETDPLLPGNRELHEALVRHGVPHGYEEYPGGHEWDYWERHVATTLRFLGTALRSGEAR